MRIGVLNELERYSNDIINQKIISCKKHQWACKRFLDDLKRQNTKDFPYIFEEKQAERFFRWMKLFKHTKGVLAGEYIDLHIFWKFVTGNIYGWVHNKTGYRRFTKGYIQVGRKNGKSQVLSGMGTYETMAYLPEGEISEVYCAATDREQAKIVYTEAVNMLNNCEELNDKWEDSYHRVTHKKSGSVFRALSRDDRKKGDGLHTQLGIIDEYHAHTTTEVYDIIKSGQQARKNPFIGIITTAGFNLNAPCYTIEYKLASDILNPDIEINIDHQFAIICELETNQTSDDIIVNDSVKIAPGELIDDISNEDNWRKANPVLCSYDEGVKNIREEFKEAQVAPNKMRNFKTKYLDIWVNERLFGYINVQKWVKCEAKIPDITNQLCYIGLDLSAKIDLTSVGFVFPRAIKGKYITLSHSFIPYSRLQERINTDNVPFDLWLEQGWLTETHGEMVDYTEMMSWIDSFVLKNNLYVDKWCIDPWGAHKLMNDMINSGKNVIEIRQGLYSLAVPTKDFRDQIYAGNIIHDGNPLLKWAFGNALTTKMDRNENFILSKKDSRDRIDPLAAMINAWVFAMVDAGLCYYEERNLRSL